MKYKKLFVAVISLTALGCTTQKPMDWSATGGSRGDGVVKLAIQYRDDIEPIVNEKQAINEATRRCKVWGYTGAEAFGGKVTHCNQWGGFGNQSCLDTIVTKEYQCTTK